jgi:hypothetical protein
MPPRLARQQIQARFRALPISGLLDRDLDNVERGNSI